MKREKIIYVIVALTLTIVTGVILSRWLVLLNMMGIERFSIVVVYALYFLQFCGLVEAIHKVLKKIETENNAKLAVRYIAGNIAITAMLIGNFSIVCDRLIILIIFCTSFLTFICMGANTTDIEKSK